MRQEVYQTSNPAAQIGQWSAKAWHTLGEIVRITTISANVKTGKSYMYVQYDKDQTTPAANTPVTWKDHSAKVVQDDINVTDSELGLVGGLAGIIQGTPTDEYYGWIQIPVPGDEFEYLPEANQVTAKDRIGLRADADQQLVDCDTEGDVVVGVAQESGGDGSAAKTGVFVDAYVLVIDTTS